MKIRQFLFAACTALVLTACSKDAIDNGHANAVEIDNITITEEPFEPETPAKSSAKQTRAVQAPQIVDLGDGVIAEVSLTEDAHEETPARTRAAIADGHYTIYASIPGGAMPNTGILKATLSGTVQGGKFVRDASSSPMRLDPGTYTFVCVNDALPLTSGGFELKNDLDNPMMATVTMPISGDFVEIPFVMKHRDTSRIRFRITSYTAEGHGITGKLSFSSITVEDYFDIEGRWFGAFPTAFTSGTYTFAESPVTPSAYTQIIKRPTDYRYFIGAPYSQGANAHFTIDGGSIYGKSLAGKSFPLTAIANLQENKSYTCNIKLKPAVLYLFQDGTVGVLSDKGTRTPIGIVVKEKTTTEKGLAIALKDAKRNIGGNIGLYWFANYMNNFENVGTGPLDFQKSLTEMKGEYWTYDPAGNVKHDVRAEKTDYLASYAAAHYDGELRDAGITLSNGMENNRWFLPSMGELALALKVLGKAQITSSLAWSGVGSEIEVNWDDVTADGYFTQAGGNALVTPLSNSRGYATSSMNDIGSSYIPYLTVQIFPSTHTLKFVHDMNIPFYTANVRPFVHF